MNAKKCDRCGKYYTYGDFVRYDGGAITIFSNTGKKVIDSKTTYDLCDDCADEFKKWMEQGNGNT